MSDGPPAFGDADYQDAMLKLAPRGRVWRRDLGSMFASVLGALAPTYTRSTASAAQLLIDTVPTTTYNLLPEWEESLGIPDPCTPLVQTIEQRQAAVAAKWAARGGQTPAFYVKLAATLGYAITITQFAPARIGRLKIGDPLYGTAWAFAWQVNAPQFTVQPFRVGHNAIGDALATWGNTYLQCRILALAPAHTTVVFNYSS